MSLAEEYAKQGKTLCATVTMPKNGPEEIRLHAVPMDATADEVRVLLNPPYSAEVKRIK